MATGLIVGESLMGVVYAFAVAGAEKAGSTDSANVLALVEPYSSVMIVSLFVFAAAMAGLYFWTKGRLRLRRFQVMMPSCGSDLPLAAERGFAQRRRRERLRARFGPANELDDRPVDRRCALQPFGQPHQFTVDIVDLGLAPGGEVVGHR